MVTSKQVILQRALSTLQCGYVFEKVHVKSGVGCFEDFALSWKMLH